jgi:hypothetical protein
LNFARERGDVVCAWRLNAKPEHAAWSCPMPAHASGVSAQPGTVRPDTHFTFARISHQSNGALRIIVAAIAASLEKEDKA